MSKDSHLDDAKAKEEVQRLFKLKKNALTRDGNHAWDHFDIAKVAVSQTSPPKFQVLLKCLFCEKTISSANPSASMPRHLYCEGWQQLQARYDIY